MEPAKQVLLAIGVLVTVVMLAIGAWAFNVYTSGIRGQGNAKIVKNSATNFITAQQSFEDLFTEIKATDQKLDLAFAEKEFNPNDRTLKTVYSGLSNHCLDAVGQYNALARKFTSAQFRASDLPPSIDSADPTTDCKETK